MNSTELMNYYKKCADGMEYAYNAMKSHFDVDASIEELMRLRGYISGGEQEEFFTDMQICKCRIDDVSELGEMALELGLLSGSETSKFFLLNDRFIIPVRDMENNIVAFIGYYPDYKKYITTPSPFFSKECLFFNMGDAYRRSYEEYDGLVILIEGIFDCLSLASIGLPAIATMGSDVSRMKGELLKVFKKVIYVPDNDVVGRRALNRRDKLKGWKVPSTAVGVRLKGSVTMQDSDGNDVVMKVKDTDNLVSWFDADSLVETFLDIAKERKQYVTLEV